MFYINSEVTHLESFANWMSDLVNGGTRWHLHIARLQADRSSFIAINQIHDLAIEQASIIADRNMCLTMIERSLANLTLQGSPSSGQRMIRVFSSRVCSQSEPLVNNVLQKHQKTTKWFPYPNTT